MQSKILAILLSTLVISLSSCCKHDAEEAKPQQKQTPSVAVKQEAAPDVVAQEAVPAVVQSEQEYSLDSGMAIQEDKIKEMEAICAEAEKLAGEDKVPEALDILRAAMKRDDFKELKSDLFFRTLYMLINLKKIVSIDGYS